MVHHKKCQILQKENIKQENQFLDLKTTSNLLSLVILAGGMGSRYNGQKQIDPIGPNGESLMEYAIFDAMEVGIMHFVFIINQQFENETRKYFQKIIELKGGSAEFVLQTTYTSVPRNYFDDIIDRKKPWGTAHALLVAKNHLLNNFIVINADDFYSKNSFQKAVTLNSEGKIAANQYGIVTYLLENTLSDNGSVSRGICKIEKGILYDVVERTNIFRYEDKIIFEDENISGVIDNNTSVSMNFWILNPSIFRFLEDKFDLFMKSYANDQKKEFFLPQVINQLIQENKVEVSASISTDQWFGMTYPGDKDLVKEEIYSKIKQGSYPKKLWY
ncbi:MAG: dTDP-glucose pyrophosphorylase [Weeksellaceae bacterium]|uniref:dTDP-glucose pyrophosphorylase n=1 Tax=Faecalibacter bovis TaxID=2898187 RepID=A0ABX7XCP4_9FLAO|nr:dTDP-glucose pyrophosphorylase [Weeksellaceae bacterium]QTV05610.1 dTDP-glucose pyrophosphorylase [Faecalibacter bovis]